jgi:5-formyltetrahydrofolate cyclo-ligase
MTKKELRNIYKEKRKSISAKDKMKWDDLLLIQLQRIDLNYIETVLSYWPIAYMQEPNTHLFSDYIEHLIPGIRLAYPICDFVNCEMKAIKVDENTEFSKSDQGIEEPVNGENIDPAYIDLVFVPLLICDKTGNRIGYGKGFYDRFLSHCRKDVLKIGFSYFDPVDKIDDTSAFDVSLNYCITPGHIYEFE